MFPLLRSHRSFFKLACWVCVLNCLVGHHYGFAQGTTNVKPDIGGILITPTKFRVDVRSGQRGFLEFRLENPSRERAIARMDIVSYLPADWTYDLQENAVNPRDASQWFAERNFAVELVPGQKKSVKLKYAVPRGLTGTYWCMLRFMPRPVSSTTPRKIVLEMPIIFMLGGRERPVVKVSSPIVTKIFGKSPKSPLLVNLPMTNEGLGLAVVGATGEIKNMTTGRVLSNFVITDRNLLPLSKRYIAFRLPELPDGQYRITMRAELGNRRLPPVSTDYVVIANEAKPITEATIMELPPVFIDPSAINLAAPAGSARSQAVRVVNTSDREIVLDIAPRALEQAATGGIGLGGESLPPGLFADVIPRSLTLRPKAMGITRLTLKSEKTAQGELWFGLAITERNNANAFSDTIESCLSIAGTTRPNLEIVNGTIEKINGRPINVGFTVRNIGNQALLPEPSAVVLEEGVRLAARLEVPVTGTGGILPGVELPNSVMLPIDLKPGEYVVEISYKFGESEDAVARLRMPITVAAPPAPAVAPVPDKPTTGAPKSMPPKPNAPFAKPKGVPRAGTKRAKSKTKSG
jgi:hypothetical protein